MFHDVNIKKIFLSLFVALAMLNLASCATTMYQPPKIGEPTANLRGMHQRSGLFSWINAKIDAIDNKSAGLQFSASSNMHIHPGRHNITILVDFSRGAFSAGPFTAITDVTANFQAGQSYSVVASIQGSRILTWIVDGTGKTISNVAAHEYMVAPTHSTIIIPAGR